MSLGMRDYVNLRIVAAVAALAAGAGACAQFGEVGSINMLPSVNNLSRPDWMTYSGGKDQFELRPVGAADLVNADGQCPAVETMSAAEPGPDGAPPLMSGGIALQMTECDVVRRAGAPENVQIGTDARGDRSVVITYLRGPRPGIYRFAAGRLTSVERAPEAGGGKAAPKAKSKKAPRSS
jgi:hypothetical protein